VNVSWDEHLAGEQRMELFVQAEDRNGLLGDMLVVLNESGAAVKSTSARTTSHNRVDTIFNLQVKGQEHLREIVRTLEQVKGVLKVSRKSSG